MWLDKEQKGKEKVIRENKNHLSCPAPLNLELSPLCSSLQLLQDHWTKFMGVSKGSQTQTWKGDRYGEQWTPSLWTSGPWLVSRQEFLCPQMDRVIQPSRPDSLSHHMSLYRSQETLIGCYTSIFYSSPYLSAMQSLSCPLLRETALGFLHRKPFQRCPSSQCCCVLYVLFPGSKGRLHWWTSRHPDRLVQKYFWAHVAFWVSH